MLQNNYQTDTICAIATNHGGALGIIRISGNNAIDIVNKCLTINLNNYKSNTLHYCNFLDIHNKVIDEVIISLYKNPHSYTGEDCIEISCHDSTYILNSIINELIDNGCRMAEPGEYTMRAYLNGKMDLSQAEAVADIIASNSQASHDIAINQLKGGFSQEIKKLRENLITISSLVELELDFSEEDIQFADRTQLANLIFQIKNKLERLINSYTLGNVIKDGIPVAIIGAPNVGKSTLLNTLLNNDKAIVSDIPGTTRDIIEDTININGVLFRFIDTAGIRETNDKIEQLGIERSKKSINTASIIISMCDPDSNFINIETNDKQKIIKIINKTSNFSALNNIGIEKLKDELLKYIKEINTSSIIVTNARHYNLLKNSLKYINNVIEALNNNIETELIAEDIRYCVNSIGEITGEVTNDDIFHNIFSHFCIGK